LLKCCREFDDDIGPGPFDLETRQYRIISSKQPVNQWFCGYRTRYDYSIASRSGGSRGLYDQGTLQAISYTPPGIGSFTTNGVGWSFVPTSDLLVTGINATGPQVSFWQGTSQLLATYAYTGPYGSIPTGPSTSFQAIPPLFLSAGQTYYISAQSSSFAAQVGFFYFGRNGVGGLTPFVPSSDITAFASYYLSPTGEWSSPFTPLSDNIDYALLGPNFQYQVVPEPSSFGLILIGVGIYGSRWRLR
jgi:hypothetical protein